MAKKTKTLLMVIMAMIVFYIPKMRMDETTFASLIYSFNSVTEYARH